MGRNGAGKTTLLKSLIRNATGLHRRCGPAVRRSTAARSKWGHEVAVGYFAQDHTESIAKGTTAIEWLHQFDPQASQEELRGLLGQMLFSGEDALKPTKALSGGEAARLIFCRLMLQKPNFLVLDEPTNHLDLESINALNIALQKYDGTVLLVTHDHDLIDEVATRIWHFEGGQHRRLQGPLRGIRGLRAGKSRPGKGNAAKIRPARPGGASGFFLWVLAALAGCPALIGQVKISNLVV